MVLGYLEQKIREKHFSSRERNLEKTAIGDAAVKGDKGKGTVEIAYNGRRRMFCERAREERSNLGNYSSKTPEGQSATLRVQGLGLKYVSFFVFFQKKMFFFVFFTCNVFHLRFFSFFLLFLIFFTF